MKNEKKLNKVLILLFVAVLIFVLLGVGLFIYSKVYVEDAKYVLKKFSNYNHNITNINPTIEYNNGYYFLSGYNRLSSNSNYFTIIKDNEIVVDLNQDVRSVEGTNIYYSIGNVYADILEYKFIDYSNDNLSTETYESLEDVQNEKFIAKKNGKYGIIDKYGKEILPFEYVEIQNSYINGEYFEKSSKYLFVFGKDKVGIVDSSTGKVIIPFEYDYIKSEYGGQDYYPIPGNIYKIKENYYFILKKDNVYYVLDINNKVILKSSDEITYNYSIDKLEIIHKKGNSITDVDYYSLDGNFIKNIKIEENWDYKNSGNNYILSESELEKSESFLIVQDVNKKDTIYLLDKNLDIKKMENVYYDVQPAEGSDIYRYYLNDEFYLLKKDNKFELYDFKTDKLLDSYMSAYYIREYYRTVKVFNLILCKEYDKSCAIMDLKKNFITDYEYEYIIDEEYSFTSYLRNKNKYRMYYDLTTELTCADDFDISKLVIPYSGKIKNFFKSKDGFLYSKNCTQVSEKKVRNSYILDNGYVVIEIDNGISDKYDYYIYDNNDKLITYDNKDQVKPYLYLGYVNNSLFFLTDKGIYNIEI